jgi:toxin CptA
VGVVGLLALLSLRLSGVPTSVAGVLAICVVIYCAVSIQRELKREPFTFIWAGGDAAAVLNFGDRQQVLSGLSLSMRGPLATIRGRDADDRHRTYLWWPDTLPSAARRQLRLAAQVSAQKQSTPTAAAK